jgi:succinoglycan biosynthesis protein ExoL
VASVAAWLRPDVRLIWDISDVNRHLLYRGIKGRVLRMVERLLVKRAQRLLLTSAQFYEQHYAGFVDRSRVRIVENRRSPRQMTTATAPAGTGPLRIVFAGIFRSPEVLNSIGAVARQLNGAAEFHLHGYPSRSVPETLPGQLASEHSNVHLHGPYDAANIGVLYGPAHFVWGFVDPSENDNEKWLLSNRLYDAIVTRRPVITNAETASGDYTIAHCLGLAVPMETRAIIDALTPYLDPGDSAYRALVAGMPAPASGYMSGEYARAIEEVLDE